MPIEIEKKRKNFMAVKLKRADRCCGKGNDALNWLANRFFSTDEALFKQLLSIYFV